MAAALQVFSHGSGELHAGGHAFDESVALGVVHVGPLCFTGRSQHEPTKGLCFFFHKKISWYILVHPVLHHSGLCPFGGS